MRRLLLAALTLICSNAFAAVEYTSANAKVGANVDASFFDSVSISEIPMSGGESGYSLITLSKLIDSGGYAGLLDVSITNLQAGSALTTANATLSVVRPDGETLWMSEPTASMSVNSALNRGFVQTTSSSVIGLVNRALPQDGAQFFRLESIGTSGQGTQVLGCGPMICTIQSVAPSAALTLTFRVSNVPELSSGAMALVGALLMPLAVGWHRTQRQSMVW